MRRRCLRTSEGFVRFGIRLGPVGLSTVPYRGLPRAFSHGRGDRMPGKEGREQLGRADRVHHLQCVGRLRQLDWLGMW